MKLIHLLPVLLALVACGPVAAQSADELPLTDETDNQYPPENPSVLDEDTLEGSGAVVLEHLDTVTETSAVELEEIKPTTDTNIQDEDAVLCPETCTCSTEGEYSFTVDCADKQLQELPLNIDPKTTTLNLQNNQITEIPNYISALKNLRVLNANDNSIKELAPGSISELPELTVLKLANNRLLEYPQELKNGFSLTKLEEIDLNGNDIRTTLAVENFLNFKVLRKITLPSSGEDITDLLCEAFRESLETVCFGSCESHSVDCPDAPQNVEEGFLEAKLPGTIALSNTIPDNISPDAANDEDEPSDNIEIGNEINTQESTDSPKVDSFNDNENFDTAADNNNVSPASDFSLRNAVNKESISSTEGPALSNSVLDPATVDTPSEIDVKVGATTVDSKSGSVDKSVIGIIVAGMILVVAGITIKKNWSSLRKRFSSSPRPANGVNGNGITPEEVPLQEKDKSPV